MKNSKPSNDAQFDYQKEQEKELKRIKSFIKNAENRGYKFYNVKVPKSLQMKEGFREFSVPQKVKKPTQKTIERLKAIDPDYLYDRAIYVDQETGDVLRGQEARRLNRSRSSKKSAISAKRFSNFGESTNQTKAQNNTAVTQNDVRTPPPESTQTKAQSNTAVTTNDVRIPPPESTLNLDIIETIKQKIDDLQAIIYGPPSLVQYKHDMGRYLSDWFEEIVVEQEDNGDIYQYAAYLNERASEINHYLDEAVRTSQQDETRMNISAFMAIINRGPLSQEQSDAVSEYTFAMGYGYEEY